MIAILAILAAILFPVFARARTAARKTVCSSNFHQTQSAVALYLGDYDDYFMPVNHRPGGPLNSRVDRTWVQLLLPYARSFSAFRCPEDREGESLAHSTFDQDLVPGDAFSQYYTASQHVNTGYNYLYLAPIIRVNNQFVSVTRSASTLTDSSRTILFVDSIGDRDDTGQPTGGGSWLVSPPCRYAQNGQQLYDTFQLNDFQPKVFGRWGWDVLDQDVADKFGGAWAWHGDKANVVRVDGSLRSMTLGQLADGCRVMPNWGGVIVDLDNYPWYGGR